MARPRFTARIVPLVLLVLAGAGLFGLLSSPAAGRSLSAVERDVVIPALARTRRPALHPWTDAALGIVAIAGGGATPLHLVPGPPPAVRAADRHVEVPPGFAEALERMAAAVTRVRAARVAPLAELASGEAADALRAAFAEAGAASIPAGPSRYWPSRLSVVGREPGGRLRAVLSSEPLMPVLRGLDEARGSWERALGLFEQHRTALEPADPRDLIGNLVRRDAARRYDDERRRAHLELVLEAVLPNLVETITLDPAAILELALDGSLPAEPLGVVAIRQSTAVNQFLGEDDASFAATVAPLTVALVLPDGSARLTRLPFPPSGQEWVTLPQAPPRGERRAP